MDLVINSQKGFMELQVETLYVKMSDKNRMLKLEVNGVQGSSATKAEAGIG